MLTIIADSLLRASYQNTLGRKPNRRHQREFREVTQGGSDPSTHIRPAWQQVFGVWL